MYQRILVPTDGSALSEQAAKAAVEFARQLGAAIVTVAVAHPHFSLAADEGTVTDLQAESAALLGQAQEHVDQVAALAKAAGVACNGVVAFGSLPHENILRAALDHQCDLIFMASHGRRGISRLLAGSVTQNVLADSTIPVLVLRPGLAS